MLALREATCDREVLDALGLLAELEAVRDRDLSVGRELLGPEPRVEADLPPRHGLQCVALGKESRCECEHERRR